MKISARRCTIAMSSLVILCGFWPELRPVAGDENAYYKLITIAAQSAQTGSRDKRWKPGAGNLVLEVSGLAALPDGRLAVAIRRGEVWLLDHVYDDPPSNVTYHRFASGLHEPMGLLQRRGALLTAQRSEVTELRDRDGDDVADEYLTFAKGWGVSGNYHEYAYGPKFDGAGNLWVTLNIGMGKGVDPRARWRGWAVRATEDGRLIPVCAGMRSPAGLGSNLAGDVFATDQQGDWIGTCSLLHLRDGAFFGHPRSLPSASIDGSPVQPLKDVPSGMPWPTALKKVPGLQPPAVWFPYKKAGQSATDVVCDTTGGRFGPFAGQLFVGEFRLASIQRVFLEKVDGQYQGAVFPFRSGFASAIVRMEFGKDGSLFTGLTNRGWSSIGSASYGLQRLVWTGKTPFEIHEVRARHDGFELRFTRPVDAATALATNSYRVRSYTYLLHSTYGSDEVLSRELAVKSAAVSSDRRRVRVRIPGLRPGFVHELKLPGLRSGDGERLLHIDAYYTLNRLPRRDQLSPPSE